VNVVSAGNPPLFAGRDPVTIRYSLTRADLLFTNARSIFLNRFILGFWTVAIIGLCITMLREPKIAVHGLAYKAVFAVIIAVFYLIVLTAGTVLLTSLMVLLRKNQGILGEHRITLPAEGLVEATDFNESLNRWSAYHRTVTTKRYLFIFVTEGLIHVVPRRRALLQGDLVEFEAALRQHTGGK